VAIYHLSAKIVSRTQGRSAVGAAAYRSAEALHDRHIGQTFDYTRKAGVEYSEILAPPEAPAWVHDREQLWNTVEQVERRKDSQLAREIEIALPVELDKDQQVVLLRDFVRGTFVSKGMVADVALHLDNAENPHAHVLLTTRELTQAGFGAKRRDWNARAELMQWREGWAGTANEHLTRAGLDLRIDHRTLEAQGIDLVPGRKVGLSVERQQLPDLPYSLLERVAEQREIAAENGRRILEIPGRALRAITHTQSTFTERDIAKYLHGRTAGAEQFQAAYLKVTTSSELVPLGFDDRGRSRFTTKQLVARSKEPAHETEMPASSMTATERLRHRSDQVAQRLAAEREQERVREVLEEQHSPERQKQKPLEQEIAKQHEHNRERGLEL
jgi:ATP-dependent exoDNAse (exonuclease V) alpha subunit